MTFRSALLVDATYVTNSPIAGYVQTDGVEKWSVPIIKRDTTLRYEGRVSKPDLGYFYEFLIINPESSVMQKLYLGYRQLKFLTQSETE
jgi:hypothetical protein